MYDPDLQSPITCFQFLIPSYFKTPVAKEYTPSYSLYLLQEWYV